MIYKINIVNYTNQKYLSFIQNKWNIQHDNTSKYSLIIKPNRIELQNNAIICKKNIWVEFNKKQMKLYQQDQAIKMIQAVGIKKKTHLSIVDATAGLGKDAFIFFSYGYQVTMIERNPIIAILLYDGLIRSYQDDTLKYCMKNKMNLIHNTALDIHKLNIQKPDVIYLDPMFPICKKKALSKKNIRTIQHIVGYDTDSDELLLKCISFTKKKVVVKRPKQSNYLANLQPSYIIYTKKYRFDVYII